MIENDIFTRLREAEEKNFLLLREYLGSTYSLVNDLIELYERFLGMIKKPLLKKGSQFQIPAILYSATWLRNEAEAGILTLMRGHITDSSNFSRRAIEISAFITLMNKDDSAAIRWMEAGNSNKARERYISRFPAWQLVKEHLPEALKSHYEHRCLDVHPSFFAVVKRASLEENRVCFKYFDLAEKEEQIYFVMQFFLLHLIHGEIMDFLSCNVFAGEHLDVSEWKKYFLDFADKWNGLREEWRSKIDKHFDDYD